jgi:hypothetical protein
MPLNREEKDIPNGLGGFEPTRKWRYHPNFPFFVEKNRLTKEKYKFLEENCLDSSI